MSNPTPEQQFYLIMRLHIRACADLIVDRAPTQEARAQMEAISGIAGLSLARELTFPDPEDAEDIRDDVRIAAQFLDPLFLALGEKLKRNFGGPVNMRMFTQVVTKAVEGDATYECEAAAERAREAAEEIEQDTRGPSSGYDTLQERRMDYK